MNPKTIILALSFLAVPVAGYALYSSFSYATFAGFVAPGTRRHRRIEDGYQNVDWDPGNYTGGKIGVGIQAGTNMSISAPILSDWRGHEVTKAEMQALTKKEALEIYKVKYWDKIKGDEIKDQTIANFIADMKSSGGGIPALQRALNTLGENVKVDGGFGDETLKAVNRQITINKAGLHNAFRDQMIIHYEGIGGPGLKNWIASMDRDYPAQSALSSNFTYYWIAAALVAVAISVYLYQKIKTKS